MVQSDASGIAFTVHPVTKDKNQMVIEAGWGLGEAIVGGMITPDTYIINKSQILSLKLQINLKSKITNIRQVIIDKNISEQDVMIVRGGDGCKQIKVSKNVAEKQKLADKKILELAKLCLDIEKHYKKPQDIEWALEKNKLYIVQSRPITTL
jgi:pyruvate,water dikinase